MNKHVCEYCGSGFKNKFSLNRHILNTKICINKRPKKCECGNNIETDKYTSHIMQCKDHIIYSLRNIIEIKDNKIEELSKEIQKLQDWKNNYFMEQNKKLEEKLDKSRSITINNPKISNNTSNNTSNNNNIMINENFNLSIIPDMSKSNIEKICHDKLTKNIVAGGDDRIAEFIVDNVFRSDDGRLIVRCTDPTRKTMTYTLDGKTQFYDIEGNKIKQSIQRGTHLYIVKYANTLVDYTNIFSMDEIFTYDKILKKICVLTYGKGCGKLDKSERKNNGKVEYIRDILRNKGLLKDEEKKEKFDNKISEDGMIKNENKENTKINKDSIEYMENENSNAMENESSSDIEENSNDIEENSNDIEENSNEDSENNQKAVLIEFIDDIPKCSIVLKKHSHLPPEKVPDLIETKVLETSKTTNIFDIDIPEEFLHDTDDLDISYKMKAKMAKEKSKQHWDSYRLTEEEIEKEMMED